jgi:hypothetical protein
MCESATIPFCRIVRMVTTAKRVCKYLAPVQGGPRMALFPSIRNKPDPNLSARIAFAEL